MPDTPLLLPPKKKRGRPRKTPNPSTTPDIDLLIPQPTTHHDLPTFLAHARATALSPHSPTYIGTHYEYTVQSSLSRLGFALTRTGRANDLGIDLLGTWTLPFLRSPLHVLVQCKAEAPKPSHVRELEGAVRGAPAAWRAEARQRAGLVAVLAARGAATKGVVEGLRRSAVGMGFVFVEAGEGGGVVRQLVWNRAAGEMGLATAGVGVRFDGRGGEEVVVTRQGEPVRFEGK